MSEDYRLDRAIRGDKIEFRLFKNNFHFASVIQKNGAFITRPHPSKDKNAWGSSIYLQPFFGDGTHPVANIEAVNSEDDQIKVDVTGRINDHGLNLEWKTTQAIAYDSERQIVTYKGFTELDSRELVGYLSLCRIASNYLVDVPLLGGGQGNTGDMDSVDYYLGDKKNTWHPHLKASHFPQSLARQVRLNMAGNYKHVDNEKLGYAPRRPLLKPGIDLTMESSEENLMCSFMFDLNHAKKHWKDNIGMGVYAKNFRKLKIRHWIESNIV